MPCRDRRLTFLRPLLPACFSQNQLATLRTITSLVLGSLCGLLGFQGLSGFAVYLAMVSLIALGVGLGKCKGEPKKYFVGGWMALGIDQDGLLAFLLCWIGAYALAHGQSACALFITQPSRLTLAPCLQSTSE